MRACLSTPEECPQRIQRLLLILFQNMNRGLHFVAHKIRHKSNCLWSILMKFTEILVSWDGSQVEALQPYCSAATVK